MFSAKLLAFSALLLVSETLGADVPFSPCPLLGPRFPIPPSISTSPIIKDGLKNLTEALDSYVKTSDGTFGPISSITTSFSITLFSTQDTDTEPFFYEYHYTAPSLNNASSEGVKKVDSNSIYRIGDVTTLFTVWLFLIEAGEEHWSDAICQHVPELVQGQDKEGGIWSPDWEGITLGDLAAHLGGIGRYSVEDEGLGKPALAELFEKEFGPATVPNSTYGQRDTSKAFLQEFNQHAPVFSPASTPIFSNAGYILLALALERIKNQPFAEILQQSILTPLRMSDTTLLQPKSSSKGVLPTNTSSWTNPQTIEAAFNGLYSTPADLSRALAAILSSTTLSKSVTNRWFKPVSQTSNPANTVGRPWEIYALTETPISPVIPIYQVRGNVGLYSSHIGLVPDYGVGFAILAADTVNNADLNAYADVLATELVPALEKNAIVHASMAFAGTYSAEKTSNSSITIAQAVDGSPGLSLSDFSHNGVDVRALYAKATKVAPENLSFRLFPTDLVESTPGADGGYKQAFRALFQDMSELADAGTPTCDTWRSVDALQIAGLPLDLFIFGVKKNGEVEKVEVPGLKLVLDKN